MFKFKKLLAICLAFTLGFSVFTANTSALSATTYSGTVYSTGVFSGKKASDLDYAALEETVLNAVKNCEASIDISSFKLSVSQLGLIEDILFYDNYEAFHCESFSYEYNIKQNIIICVKPAYSYGKSKYTEYLYKLDAVADYLLTNIAGNSKLTDVQKALLIHDRLAVWVEYDHASYYANTDSAWNTHTVLGALIDRYAVCDGYSKAYKFLLEKVGIESELVISVQLNHAWNIVYIKGVPYHVDVTWDDDDILGGVNHDYFLLSSKALYKNKHAANDYSTLPKSPKYDNYFWQSSMAEFQLLNENEIYYINNEKQCIYLYSSSGKRQAVKRISSVWQDRGSNKKYANNFSRLAASSDLLIYSVSNGIYSFDPKTEITCELYSLNDNYPADIFGFEYDELTGRIYLAFDTDCEFVCEIPNSSNSHCDYAVYYFQWLKCDHSNFTVYNEKATCTQTGIYDKKVCNTCNTVLNKGTVIPKTEHSYKNSTCKKATLSSGGKIATVCKSCGKTKYSSFARIKSVKLSRTTYTQDGKLKTPTVTVKDAKGKVLVENKDYTVTYPKGRKNVGSYKVKITFKGNYSGKKYITFKILPQATKIKKLTPKKESFGIKWSKSTFKADGYQITVSTSKKFTRSSSVTFKNTAGTSGTVYELSANKKYYVKIRAYKKVNGKCYYSDWSAVKSVKTK